MILSFFYENIRRSLSFFVSVLQYRRMDCIVEPSAVSTATILQLHVPTTLGPPPTDSETCMKKIFLVIKWSMIIIIICMEYYQMILYLENAPTTPHVP